MEKAAFMILMDFDPLLRRMVSLEHAAFVDFDDSMRDAVARWLIESGVPEAQIAMETPRCLLALGIMIVQRRSEIEPGRFLLWCHVQVRNLAVAYWRELDAQRAPRHTLTAKCVRAVVECIDGTGNAYARAASALGVSAGWLRHRHQRMLMSFGLG